MQRRFLAAGVCAAAIVFLLLGAFSKRWLVADLRSSEANGSLRISLTGVSACIATTEIARCEQVEWSQVSPHAVGSSWTWFGRITFGLSLAAAIALLVVGGLAAANVSLELPFRVPRAALWLCATIYPFMIGYWLMMPTGLGNAVSAGRGFLFATLGATLGMIGAGLRTLDDRDAF